MKTIAFLAITLHCISQINCSGGNSTQPRANTPRLLEVSIDNQSQFEIENIMIHNEIGNYNLDQNILTLNLAVGQKWSTQIIDQPWYVTVLRRPNKDSEALAYSTARPWDPGRFRRLIYFDEQFRGASEDFSRPAINASISTGEGTEDTTE